MDYLWGLLRRRWEKATRVLVVRRRRCSASLGCVEREKETRLSRASDVEWEKSLADYNWGLFFLLLYLYGRGIEFSRLWRKKRLTMLVFRANGYDYTARYIERFFFSTECILYTFAGNDLVITFILVFNRVISAVKKGYRYTLCFHILIYCWIDVWRANISSFKQAHRYTPVLLLNRMENQCLPNFSNQLSIRGEHRGSLVCTGCLHHILLTYMSRYKVSDCTIYCYI